MGYAANRCLGIGGEHGGRARQDVRLVLTAVSRCRRETYPILAFGPAALAGNLLVHFGLVSYLEARQVVDRDHTLSHAVLVGHGLFAGLLAVVGAAFGVGSAYVAALNLGSSLFALLCNDLLSAGRDSHLDRRHVHLVTYLAGSVKTCNPLRLLP